MLFALTVEVLKQSDFHNRIIVDVFIHNLIQNNYLAIHNPLAKYIYLEGIRPDHPYPTDSINFENTLTKWFCKNMKEDR